MGIFSCPSPGIPEAGGRGGEPSSFATSNKRKYGAGGWLSFEDEGYNSSDEYEYDSEDSVDEGNAKSFGQRIHKKLDDGVLKIGGVFRNKEWFTCPFCPGTPKDGNWHALAVHGESLSLYGQNKKVRVQHDVLSHFMCGVNRPNVVPRSDKKKKKWF